MDLARGKMEYGLRRHGLVTGSQMHFDAVAAALERAMTKPKIKVAAKLAVHRRELD